MKKLLITLAALTLMAGSASATILWDQSEIGWSNNSYFDSESGCGGFMGQATVHTASDITIGDEVTVTTITTYYTIYYPEIQGVTEAYLYIGLKTGSTPVNEVDNVNDPSLLVPVTVTATDPGDGGSWYYTVVADGLNIDLTPGDYWVALTPANYSVGPSGPNYHLGAANFWGDATATIEYCGMFAPSWYALYPGNDASLLIEGTVNVVATEQQNWCHVKALYR